MSETKIKIILLVSIVVTIILSFILHAFVASLISGQGFKREFDFYFISTIPLVVLFMLFTQAFFDNRLKENADKSPKLFFLSYLLGIPIAVSILCLARKYWNIF